MHEPHTVPKRIGMLEFGRRALKKVVSGAHHTLVLADDFATYELTTDGTLIAKDA